MSLFDQQVELLKQRGIVVKVDRDLVVEVQIERWRGLFTLLDAELAAREFSIRGDDGTSLGDVDQVGGVERRVAEIPTARRTGEIEHLAVDRLHFQLQMALELIEVERASDAQRAERFVGLEETDRKVFHLGGRDVAVEFAAFAGKACERSVSLHNLVCDFSSDELRHEVRAEGELQRSGTPGLK